MCTFSANVAFDTATYGRTNRDKTRDVVKTYVNVTFEDQCPFSKLDLSISTDPQKAEDEINVPIALSA